MREFFVTDAIMTAGGELKITIWCTYFFTTGSVALDYVITGSGAGGTAVEGVDYDGSADPLSGTVTFNQWDQHKTIRINTIPGGGPANRTVICTLPSSLLHRDGRAVGTGTIQDGTLYHFAAAGNPGAAGTELDPLDIFSMEALMKVVPATGAGRAMLLRSGDTFPDWDGLDVEGAKYGGTVANPMIVATYNNDQPRPILYLSGPIGVTGGNEDNNARTIFQDLELRPWSTGEVNQPIFHSQNAGHTALPTGTKYLRILAHNPDNYAGFRQVQIKNCIGLEFKFNDIFECKLSGFLSTNNEDSFLIANYFKDNGDPTHPDADGTRDWAIYNSHDHGILNKANRFKDNVEGNKIRACGIPSKPGSTFTHNYFEIKAGTAVGGYNANGSIFQGAYEPLEDCLMEKNVFVGGMALFMIEADSREEIATGNQVIFINLIYQNNIHFQDQDNRQSSYENVKGSFERNDGVHVRHNTIFLSGVDYHGIQQPVPGDGDIVTPDPTWAPNIDYLNNIVIREGITSTTDAVVNYGGDPNQGWLYNQNNNNYYDEDGNTMKVNQVDYSLASYQAAFPGREAGSVEANPILVAGSLPVRAFPTVSIAAQPGLVPDDFWGKIRPLTAPSSGAIETHGGLPVYAG